MDEDAKSVRLPKITNMIQPGDVGVFTAAGLPEISGDAHFRLATFGSSNTSITATRSGAFRYSSGTYPSNVGTLVGGSGVTTNIDGVRFDASNSNPIYGNSTTVQPPAVGAKLYIQVFTSAVPASMAQAGEFINMLESYLPLSGGTMAGNVFWGAETGFGIRYSGNSGTFGWSYGDCTGSGIAFRGVGYNDHPGSFYIFARDATNTSGLNGHVDGTLLWNGQSVLNPIGTVIAFAGNSAPAGYLICNGAAISRTTYAKLFAIIGTTYGTGNGSTTFNLPNLTDRVVQGSATAGTALAAGLPNITGYFQQPNKNIGMWEVYGSVSGAFSGQGGTEITARFSKTAYTSTGSAIGINIDASRSSAIYGNSNTVQPPALTMIYCIKY